MIQLRNFQLKPYWADDMTSFKVMKELNRDEKVKQNMTWRFEELLVKEPSQDETLELGKAYLVERNGEILGMTGAKELVGGVSDLWVALLPSYRNKSYYTKYQNPHYGSKLLSEMTLYMIEHIEGLKDVSLTIHTDNFASIQSCEQEGFSFYEKNGKNKVYRYFNR